MSASVGVLPESTKSRPGLVRTPPANHAVKAVKSAVLYRQRGVRARVQREGAGEQQRFAAASVTALLLSVRALGNSKPAAVLVCSEPLISVRPPVPMAVVAASVRSRMRATSAGLKAWTLQGLSPHRRQREVRAGHGRVQRHRGSDVASEDFPRPGPTAHHGAIRRSVMSTPPLVRVRSRRRDRQRHVACQLERVIVVFARHGRVRVHQHVRCRLPRAGITDVPANAATVVPLPPCVASRCR